MQEPDVVCLGETMAMVTPSPARPLAEAQKFTLSQGGKNSPVARSPPQAASMNAG